MPLSERTDGIILQKTLEKQFGDEVYTLNWADQEYRHGSRVWNGTRVAISLVRKRSIHHVRRRLRRLLKLAIGINQHRGEKR